MLKKLLIILVTLLVACSVLLENRAYAYFVSGLVEFSYRDYSSKIGSTRTVDRVWSQHYAATLQDYLDDPRFMIYTASVGYDEYRSYSAQDSRSLNYELRANFFPGMKVNAEIFGGVNTTTVMSNTSLIGYEVETTRYGGTMNLNLSRGVGSNNNSNRNNRSTNNNNDNSNGNNNSNTNGYKWSFPLPDITLTSTHTEAQSLSASVPRNETLDSSLVGMRYQPTKSVSMDFSAGLDQYRNKIDDSSYDTKTVALTSYSSAVKGADLKVDARRTERTLQNITGYDTYDLNTTVAAKLDYKEKERLKHYYSYNYSDLKSSSSDILSHQADAEASYRLTNELLVTGGLILNMAEYVTKATASTPEDTKSTLFSGGVQAGISYTREYQPEFLGPFALNTNYKAGYGFANYSTNIVGQADGSGVYYTNSGGLGLVSKGWQKDSVSLVYSYNNRRDHSPLHVNTEAQSVNLNMTTQRVPRTNISLSSSYQEQNNSAGVSSILVTNTTTNVQNRTFTYLFIAEHFLNDYVTLATGATRQQAKSTTDSSTLSTLASTDTSIDEVVYASAQVKYAFTRNLNCKAGLRNEWRKTKSNHSESTVAEMYLNYRIRKVFVSFEAHWKEDLPSDSLRTEQTSYYVKISRPF